MHKVTKYLKDNNLFTITIEGEHNNAYFQCKGCDCCNDGLGNNVVDAIAIDLDDQTKQYEVQACWACLSYCANGE